MAARAKRETDTWSLAEAKAKFSEVVERATHEGPQRVTKHGRDAVVVVDADEWRRRAEHRETLLDIFAKAQLEEGELDLSRDRTPLRDIDL